eukprot:scaffold1593_cov193-Alexandrium_tamarense.AAC.73
MPPRLSSLSLTKKRGRRIQGREREKKKDSSTRLISQQRRLRESPIKSVKFDERLAIGYDNK